MRRTIIAVAVVATALALAPPASATRPTSNKVTICHATGSESNPYVELTVDIASAGYLKHGHSDHEDDVIPPYEYVLADGTVFTFEGQGDQSLLEDGCEIPDVDPPTCEELDNCPPPPCEGNDCEPPPCENRCEPPPPPPERLDKSTYRIVTRMPHDQSVVNFFADADIHIRYSCGREEFRVRLTGRGRNGYRYDYLIWMAGNSNRSTIIRVREENVVRRVGRARC